MTVPWVRVEPLANHHNTSDFYSGRDSVDTWFREKALNVRHVASTHVCVDDAGTVRGFFALMTIVVNTSGLSNQLRRGADEHGMSPAILLAQMGVRESDQGSGNGTALFFRAVDEVLVADAASRVPLLVVDAADEGLVAFYQKLGMKPIPHDLRLVASLSKLRR